MKRSIRYFALVLLSLPYAVRAAQQAASPLVDLEAVGKRVYGTTAAGDIKLIIANLVQVVLGLVGLIFVILIIWGGLQWMTSGGNEKSLEEAKKRIVNATIGLVIVVIAYAIAFSITNWLVQATTSSGGSVPSATGTP